MAKEEGGGEMEQDQLEGTDLEEGMFGGDEEEIEVDMDCFAESVTELNTELERILDIQVRIRMYTYIIYNLYICMCV